MNHLTNVTAEILRVTKSMLIFLRSNMIFRGSEDYWKRRYKCGGNSGDGSYNKLAGFKAEILNDFVVANGVRTVIEYGCGDGNQLLLAKYPSYIGYDVSESAISLCRDIFHGDKSKQFKLINEYGNESADLTLSLDVIYHLVENDVFASYMARLFDSSNRFVIIYSSNTDRQTKFQPIHIRNRIFSQWVENNRANWKIKQYIPNRYPFDGTEGEKSISDFYIYENNK